MLVDLTTAKLHLRVDHAAEDALITIWIGVAEDQVAQFLNRNIYEDEEALEDAIAAAPAALTAATATYDAAILVAEAIEDLVEMEAATRYAVDVYAAAVVQSNMTQAGIVVNDSIKAAVLLILQGLYERDPAEEAKLREAAYRTLQRHRVGLGV